MKPYLDQDGITIYHGDCLTILPYLPENSINCCVTSPPYWGLRDYGAEDQIGLEPTPEKYVASLVTAFQIVRRVLRDDGTLWLNLGDTYASEWPCQRRNVIGNPSLANGKREARPARMPAGLKEKDLVGIPWRVAFALQQDGWYLRQDIIWHKPNPTPESVTDRCTKAHEYLFLLSKNQRYYYDQDAIKESKPDGTGRNKRSVWTVNPKPYHQAHFATFPPELIGPCIRAGCPEGGTVLDPFLGSGTTAEVARRLHCNCIGIELNPEYCKLAKQRLAQQLLPFD